MADRRNISAASYYYYAIPLCVGVCVGGAYFLNDPSLGLPIDTLLPLLFWSTVAQLASVFIWAVVHCNAYAVKVHPHSRAFGDGIIWGFAVLMLLIGLAFVAFTVIPIAGDV